MAAAVLVEEEANEVVHRVGNAEVLQWLDGKMVMVLRDEYEDGGRGRMG